MYTLKAVIIFILLLLFMRQSSLYAQLNTLNARYISRTFDNKNGLPQNTVYDVVKDSTGMLFIGTDEGLAIYDGNDFNVHNEENTDGLNSSAFYDLCPASGSGIWAASRNNILLYKQQHIEVFDFTSLIKGSWITSITEDGFGKLWVGTNSGSLFYLEGKQLILFEKWQSKYRQSIQVLRPYKNGILAGTDKGLFKISSSAITAIKEFDGKNIRALESDKAESMWVGTKGDGLFRINDSVVQFTEKQGLLELIITSLAFHPNGHLWIGTSSSGVQKFAEGNFTPFKESSFLNDKVRCILPDNGEIWIGTTGSGLIQMIPAEVDMLSDVPALSDNIILPIYQHTSGDVWIGTAGNGVYRLANGKTTHYTKRSGLPGEIILSIGGTKDAIFIGTTEGLTRINLKTSKIDKHYRVKEGLINDIVQTIFTDSQQRVWIGSHSGGIHFIGHDDSIVTVRTPSKFNKAEFVSAFEDHNRNIWFGTSGAGILKITADGRIDQFNTNLGLSADMVYGFYEDQEGDLWLATQAGLVNYAKGKFSLFNKSSGLSYNGIYRIIDDGNGSLWLSGNFGIQQVTIRNLLDAKNKTEGSVSLHARLFDLSDGMSNSEANGGIFPAGWKMRNGSIWFPTVKGIAVINPLQIKTRLPELKVRIQSVNFAEQSIPPGDKILIPPGVFNIEIDYGSIHFTKQHTINYLIRIPGIDTSWTNVGNRRTAYYTSLNPGNYIFEVKAEQFGRFSEVAKLEFTVEPFFYQTRWFNTGMLMLLFISGIFIKQLHSKYRRETVLKKLVEERTIELNESHIRFKKQELELTKAVIHAQEHERFQIGAELHDNVNQLLATARLTLSLVKPTTHAHEEWLDKTRKYIGEAINEIRALSHRLAPPSFGEQSLKEAINGLIGSINEDRRYTVQIDADDCIGLENVENNIQLSLYRILQEQMKNIRKYSYATKIFVCLQQQEKKICMTVVDNGKGFNLQKVKRGIGLNNMKKRAEMFNGTFDLQSSPGNGCRLTVEIPL